MDEEKRSPKWLQPLLVGAVGLCVLVALGLLVKSFLGKGEAPKPRPVQQIALLKPPPPPPPPKPEEKLPDLKKEEVKIPDPAPEQPQQAPDNAPPPGQDLGLDAEGTSGSDGFNLAAKKGGRGLLDGGGGGYGVLVQRHLQDLLSRDPKLRKSDYRVVVKLWFTGDGRLQRFELTGSTGNPDTDRNIKTALADVGAFPQAPPEAMPQPLRIRITSRGAG